LAIASHQEKYDEKYHIVNIELKELIKTGDIMRNVIAKI
jgi:hypothetical protein